MKTISLVLLIAGYASLLPVNAVWLGLMDNSCVVYGFPLVEILLCFLGLALMGGYRKAAAGNFPWSSPRLFWSVSTVFNAGIAAYAFWLTGGASSALKSLFQTASEIHGSVTRPYDPGVLLDAVASFIAPLVLLWMPIAAALSAFALRFSWNDTFVHPFRSPDSTST